MELEEYTSLMESVSKFAQKAGLKTEGLYNKVCTNPSGDKWMISVSQRTAIDNCEILYSYDDRFLPDFDWRLVSPVFGGTRDEVEAHKRTAMEKKADYFSKKCIAYEGFVEPSPEFLALSDLEKVEYALHEAFHKTPKLLFGKKTLCLLPSYEEASALIVGYLGAVHYFRGTGLEGKAAGQYQEFFSQAEKVNLLFDELQELYQFRLGNTGEVVSSEQKLKEREEVFAKAKIEFGDNLSGPINNAFFMYWRYFYEKVGSMHDKIKRFDDFNEVVSALKVFNSWE